MQNLPERLTRYFPSLPAAEYNTPLYFRQAMTAALGEHGISVEAFAEEFIVKAEEIAGWADGSRVSDYLSRPYILEWVVKRIEKEEEGKTP